MNLSEDIIHGKVCPVCGKPVDAYSKDTYDAYRHDGVILSDGYHVMCEDHGPHLRFHSECTLGIKDNGNGFWDIVIDKDKYWDKDDKDYEWYVNKDNVEYIDKIILSAVQKHFLAFKCKIEADVYENTDTRLVTIYGVKPKDMFDIENKIWDIIAIEIPFGIKYNYIPCVVSLRNTKKLYPDMMPDNVGDSIITKIKHIVKNVKDWIKKL